MSQCNGPNGPNGLFPGSITPTSVCSVTCCTEKDSSRQWPEFLFCAPWTLGLILSAQGNFTQLWNLINVGLFYDDVIHPDFLQTIWSKSKIKCIKSRKFLTEEPYLIKQLVTISCALFLNKVSPFKWLIAFKIFRGCAVHIVVQRPTVTPELSAAMWAIELPSPLFALACIFKVFLCWIVEKRF